MILNGNKRNYKSFNIIIPPLCMDLLGHREPIFASHRECVLQNQDEIGFDLLTSYYVNPHHKKTLKLNDHYYPCSQEGT